MTTRLLDSKVNVLPKVNPSPLASFLSMAKRLDLNKWWR